MAQAGKPHIQYLSLSALQHLVGSVVDGYIGALKASLLYFQLESFLAKSESTYEASVGNIPQRLLEHNQTKRDLIRCEMAPIDADLCFFFDAAANKMDIQWKSFSANPELSRPERERRVVLHIVVTETTGLVRVISAPLQVLMEGYGDVTIGHQGYSHSIVFRDGEGVVIDEQFYIGITSRNWLVRMEEHLAEIRGGSNKRFHAAWRAYAGDTKVMLCSELVVINQTFEGVMDWEEQQVDKYMSLGTSLNMIPGGFKGLRFLHEHRITERVNIGLEERDLAIATYVQRHGVRSGVPNLLLAELWRTDDFYLRVLAGRDDVLSPGQVLSIRDLASKGHTASQIFAVVGARNLEQVQRVLSGKTYKRIHSGLPLVPPDDARSFQSAL